eukprot:gene9273-biopygen8039
MRKGPFRVRRPGARIALSPRRNSRSALPREAAAPAPRARLCGASVADPARDAFLYSSGPLILRDRRPFEVGKLFRGERACDQKVVVAADLRRDAPSPVAAPACVVRLGCGPVCCVVVGDPAPLAPCCERELPNNGQSGDGPADDKHAGLRRDRHLIRVRADLLTACPPDPENVAQQHRPQFRCFPYGPMYRNKFDENWREVSMEKLSGRKTTAREAVRDHRIWRKA